MNMSAKSLEGLVALGIALGVFFNAPASAQLSKQGTGNCKVGGAVATRDGNVDIVDSAEGNSCYVKFPDGTREYKLQWMLTPAKRARTVGRASEGMTSAKSGSGAVQAGNYQCYGARLAICGSPSEGTAGTTSTPSGSPTGRLAFRPGQMAAHIIWFANADE